MSAPTGTRAASMFSGSRQQGFFARTLLEVLVHQFRRFDPSPEEQQFGDARVFPAALKPVRPVEGLAIFHQPPDSVRLGKPLMKNGLREQSSTL